MSTWSATIRSGSTSSRHPLAVDRWAASPRRARRRRRAQHVPGLRHDGDRVCSALARSAGWNRGGRWPAGEPLPESRVLVRRWSANRGEATTTRSAASSSSSSIDSGWLMIQSTCRCPLVRRTACSPRRTRCTSHARPARSSAPSAVWTRTSWPRRRSAPASPTARCQSPQRGATFSDGAETVIAKRCASPSRGRTDRSSAGPARSIALRHGSPTGSIGVRRSAASDHRPVVEHDRAGHDRRSDRLARAGARTARRKPHRGRRRPAARRRPRTPRDRRAGTPPSQRRRPPEDPEGSRCPGSDAPHRRDVGGHVDRETRGAHPAVVRRREGGRALGVDEQRRRRDHVVAHR